MNESAIAAPYEESLVVKPEWLDDNGHMNVAFYVHAFDDGGEVFFRDCGIGWDYTRKGAHSIFMANCDLDFRRELFQGDPLRVTTQLIDWSAKLVHTYQALYHRDENYLAATAEMLFVHVAFADRRSTDMSPATQARLAQIARVHRNLPEPDNLGRKIEIRH
jgi:acyl-CoA thioester hydrolase